MAATCDRCYVSHRPRADSGTPGKVVGIPGAAQAGQEDGTVSHRQQLSGSQQQLPIQV